MYSGLGACQMQHATSNWKKKQNKKKQGNNFISLVALNFAPEFDVLLCNFSPG